MVSQLMAGDHSGRKKAHTVPHKIGERPIISRHDIIQPEDCMASDLIDIDYAALAEFRFALRRFQMFSETKAGEAGLTPQQQDRKSVVEGESVSVRVDLGGGRIIKKKKN